jgi:hypothetical protein
MAQPKLGILALVSPAATTDTALYTPSSSTRRAVVSTLLIVNTTGAPVQVRLYFRPSGAQPLTWGIALDGAVGDAISCRASATGVNFFVFGNEEDIPAS